MNNKILDVSISPINYLFAAQQIISWTHEDKSRVVYAANVHMLMEAHDFPGYKAIINSADIVTPDGMPLVWMLRIIGFPYQQRVYCPTLMLHVLEIASREDILVGFFGAEEKVLTALVNNMKSLFPGLKVVYQYSPPFRAMSLHEDLDILEKINQSGARILFVGLGCPKQEIWIAEHRGKVKAVMIGVGAAFDFHAGVKPQAPAWMQKLGLEWFFRLMTEPRRLWKRYLFNNPRFIFLAILDLVKYFRRAE